MEVSHTTSSWEIIRRSTYIKVLAAGFQFKVFIQDLYPDPHALTQFLGKFYVGLNALALAFQSSVGGWLLYRLGLGPTTGLQPITALMLVAGMARTLPQGASSGTTWGDTSS